MSALAERPGFEPHLDYLRTFEAMELAFASNAAHVYEPTEGVRMLAGNIGMSSGKLSHVDEEMGEAHRVSVTLIETEDPELGLRAYRHDFQVFDAAGLPLGEPDTGIYHLDASESEWKKRTKMGGERHRELVSDARYDITEALLVAQDEVHADVLDNAERNENAAERAAHWLVKKEVWSRRFSRAVSALSRWCSPLIGHMHLAANTHDIYQEPGNTDGSENPGPDTSGNSDTAG